MVATTYASLTILKEARQVLGINAGRYKLILSSDAVKFFVVFLIDSYKAATAFDLLHETGILLEGNLGFQHFIDTLKISVMVGSLILPAVVKFADGSKPSDEDFKRMSLNALNELEEAGKHNSSGRPMSFEGMAPSKSLGSLGRVSVATSVQSQKTVATRESALSPRNIPEATWGQHITATPVPRSLKGTLNRPFTVAVNDRELSELSRKDFIEKT
ncbi:hypothetical protein HDU99_001163 [Rhizoclosmatium hyalinum]|nr:hypothetical protein HDU99_001163 [Rhizoclosmatium hyalinum]